MQTRPKDLQVQDTSPHALLRSAVVIGHLSVHLSFHCCVATHCEAVGLCMQCLVCAPALPWSCFHFRGKILVYFPPRCHPLAKPRVCRTKERTAEEPALQTRALGGFPGCTYITSYLLMEIGAVSCSRHQ